MVFVYALRPAHYRTRGVLFENNWLSTTFSVRAFHLIALVLLTIQVLLSCRRGASDGSTGMEEVLHGWIVVGVALFLTKLLQ